MRSSAGQLRFLSSWTMTCAPVRPRHLGPGLLESAYEQCMCHELSLTGLSFARQKPLPVNYKGVTLDCGYRLDVVVEEKLVLELKAVDRLLAVHEAQVLTYLKLTD